VNGKVNVRFQLELNQEELITIREALQRLASTKVDIKDSDGIKLLDEAHRLYGEIAHMIESYEDIGN
jgi:hypothetical protein